MKRKKQPLLPRAKCDVPGCDKDAAYGFRETIDVSSSTASGFIMGTIVNWCKGHDFEQRPIYASKSGDYIKFRR